MHIRILALAALVLGAPAMAKTSYLCQQYSERNGDYTNWTVDIVDQDEDGEYTLDVRVSYSRNGREFKRTYYDYDRDGVTVFRRGKGIYTSAGRTVGLILSEPQRPVNVGGRKGALFSERFNLTLGELHCNLNGMESAPIRH